MALADRTVTPLPVKVVDSVDWAILKVVASDEFPDDQFVMTTWHADEPISEVFGFAARKYPTVPLEQIVIIDIGPTNREAEMLHDYTVAQMLSD